MKKDKKSASSSSLIVTIAVLLMAAISAENGKNADIIRSISIPLVIIAVIMLIAKAKKANMVSPEKKPKPSSETNTVHLNSGREENAALGSQGKQRYLDQAELFYKNGIIDKEEYRAIKERYSKLEIPEER